MNDKFIREYKRNIIVGLTSGLATGFIFQIGEYFGDKIEGSWGFGLKLLLPFVLTIGFIIYIAKMKIK